MSIPAAARPFIEFPPFLRSHGFAVSPDQTIGFLQAVGLLGPRNMEDIRRSAIAMLAIPKELEMEFDACFRAFFLGQTVAAPADSGRSDEEPEAREDRGGDVEVEEGGRAGTIRGRGGSGRTAGDPHLRARRGGSRSGQFCEACSCRAAPPKDPPPCSCQEGSAVRYEKNAAKRRPARGRGRDHCCAQAQEETAAGPAADGRFRVNEGTHGLGAPVCPPSELGRRKAGSLHGRNTAHPHNSGACHSEIASVRLRGLELWLPTSTEAHASARPCRRFWIHPGIPHSHAAPRWWCCRTVSNGATRK